MENEEKYSDPSNKLADENFYPEAELQFLEKVWGKGFVSPGGPEEVAEILRDVDFKNKRILDIGCGMGGIEFRLVEPGPLPFDEASFDIVFRKDA